MVRDLESSIQVFGQTSVGFPACLRETPRWRRDASTTTADDERTSYRVVCCRFDGVIVQAVQSNGRTELEQGGRKTVRDGFEIEQPEKRWMRAHDRSDGRHLDPASMVQVDINE